MDQPSPMQTPMPWNLVADAYAAEVVPMFEAYARDALAIAKVTADTRVVDVACGPGTLALLAGRAGARVEAIDFSPAMVEHCQRRIAHLGVTGVTVRVGDGQALPFDAGAFYAAFSMFGLMFFPDRAKGFAELRRVLVPGGRAVVSTWTPLEDTPVLAAMFDALRTKMADMLGPAAPPPGPTLPLTTEADCRAEMAAAGFRDVDVRRISHPLRAESGEELWASIERTMAPIALMKRSMGQRWAAMSLAARDAICTTIANGPVELAMTALVTSGVA